MSKKLRSLWSDSVAEYKASGMGGKEWCKAGGLKENQLWYWVRKESESKAQTEEWAEVALRDVTLPGLVIKVAQVCIEVQLGFDPHLWMPATNTSAPQSIQTPRRYSM